MDMETDSDDEEDGQISKLEEEEEKDRKRYGKSEPEEEPITLEDLNKCRLTRDLLVKYWMAPWFEEYIKGMFYFHCRGINSAQGHICIKGRGCDTSLARRMVKLSIAYAR
jgi:RNA polymerase-associated protein RTF1